MKRSQINRACGNALACFTKNGWALPPVPQWDVTDSGLDTFDKCGLVLVNLANEPEYCEKLMYARKDQVTPFHTHAKKKEDIICRWGKLAVELWAGHPEKTKRGSQFSLKRSGAVISFQSGDRITLEAGERVTLVPGVYHSFWPETEECIIGEVSTANDDLHDNFFVDPNIGRFPEIVEDEPVAFRLVHES